MTQSLIPREAALLALSLELLAARKRGEKSLEQSALARVRKRTVEISGCSKKFAADIVAEVSKGIQIKPSKRSKRAR
jgi:hypothetical protein